MWIRPSIPSRSTKAPKSTMLEIWPFDDEAGLQAVEDLLADLLALLLEHRAAREHDVVARAVELDHLGLDLRAHVLVEVGHAADVDERGGQEAAHAEVDDQAALDDLDDGALDRLAGLGRRFDAPPRLLEAGALLGHDQAPVLVLLGEDDRVDLLAEVDLLAGVDGLADRQLVGGDDALGLVADVDEDLVLVDPHDVAGDNLALLDRAERGVVVGDDLAVDFEQQAVGPVDDAGSAGSSVTVCTGRSVAQPYHCGRNACSSDEAGRGPHPLGARLRRARLRGELRRARRRARARRHRARACWWSTATRSASARPRPARSRPRGCRRSSWTARCARASTSSSSTRPIAPRAGSCRGRSRHSTTASCARCCGSRRRRRARVRDRDRHRPQRRHRPHRPRRAPRAADRRRASAGGGCSPTPADPAARARASRAAWRSTLRAAAARWSCGSTPATCAPATPGASPPATSCASASAPSGPPTTSRSRPCGSPRDLGLPADGYQGNWIPHQLRAAVEDGVFFAGDSAGHCLPLTAEGIRTALYFGLACGRELRAVLDGTPHPRAGAGPLRRLLGLPRAQIPLAAERSSGRSARSPRAAPRPPSCAPSRAAA